MNYEYVYTPDILDESLFEIRDVKDYPVLYTAIMSRLNNNGDWRIVSIPEISAYVALIEFLRQNANILEHIIQLSMNDVCSFSRIVDSNEDIVVNDGFYGTSDLNLEIRNDGDVSWIYEKNRLLFLNNMYKK